MKTMATVVLVTVLGVLAVIGTVRPAAAQYYLVPPTPGWSSDQYGYGGGISCSPGPGGAHF